MSRGGTGNLHFYKVAPMLVFGFGNLIPRNNRRFSISFDVGAAYQGPPRTVLALTGSACDSNGLNCVPVSDPAIQSKIVAEQGKVNRSASAARFYPVLSIGFGYKF